LKMVTGAQVNDHRGDICPWRHAYLFDNLLRRLIHPPHRILGPYVREGMTVVDIGCGMGVLSIGAAKLIGRAGEVIGVDLQQEMLDVLRNRAERAGVAERMRLRRCAEDRLALDVSADFVLAFWVVHEVPDQGAFFREVRSLLREDGKLLVAEPIFHTSARDFKEAVRCAEGSGLTYLEEPRILFCRSALFGRSDCARAHGEGAT
jgi:2-polyprenyl-3-methyl-5-hydroxy-6-metoxy-1,4-benzoquinol methylase